MASRTSALAKSSAQRKSAVKKSPAAKQRKVAAMRVVLSLFLFLGSVMSAEAETFVYVSMAPEQKIRIYRKKFP